MFTGIIESTAYLVKKQTEGSNAIFYFSSPVTRELKVDQSLAHNGVCLTVTGIEQDIYTVTAVEETLRRSNLGSLKVGEEVNLERCMKADGRFDGHIVQGHVDTTMKCTQIDDRNGSHHFYFALNDNAENLLLVDKGSVCINGVSLTVMECGDDSFSVTIIPYTFEHSNFKHLKEGAVVNIEFDILGKYIRKQLARQNRERA